MRRPQGDFQEFRIVLSTLDTLIDIATPGDESLEGEPNRRPNGDVDFWDVWLEEPRRTRVLNVLRWIGGCTFERTTRALTRGTRDNVYLVTMSREFTEWVTQAAAATGLAVRPD